jgi:hypothetical protein
MSRFASSTILILLLALSALAAHTPREGVVEEDTFEKKVYVVDNIIITQTTVNMFGESQRVVFLFEGSDVSQSIKMKVGTCPEAADEQTCESSMVVIRFENVDIPAKLAADNKLREGHKQVITSYTIDAIGDLMTLRFKSPVMVSRPPLPDGGIGFTFTVPNGGN